MTDLELPKWQSDLIDRMNANDFKLFNLREQHWLVVNERRPKHAVGSNAYNQYCAHLVKIRQRISTVLDDIAYTRQLWLVGPIIGDVMALPIGYKGRTLIEMIEGVRDLAQKEADIHADYKDEEEHIQFTEAQHRVYGINAALDVLQNPRKYLSPEEITDWSQAEEVSKKIIRPSGTTTHHQDHQSRRSTTEPTVKEARRNTITVVRRKKA